MSEHITNQPPHPTDEHITHAPVHHPTEEMPYFPREEWDQFKNDDIAAGKGVIILMTAIFTTGLILYSIVAIVTGS
jgi:hypothetical protein